MNKSLEKENTELKDIVRRMANELKINWAREKPKSLIDKKQEYVYGLIQEAEKWIK
jgi:hypothetical protein